MKLRLIFVMDLLDGQVVHALRGQRDQYQPINRFSSVVLSPDPCQILQELKPRELYIADLNRLTNRGDNSIVIKALRSEAPRSEASRSEASRSEASRSEASRSEASRSEAPHIMLDYGLHELEEFREPGVAELADTFVLGTETASLDLIATAAHSEIPVSVSVDIINNAVLALDKNLRAAPLDVLKLLNEYPLEEVIVLNLDRVGSRSGIDRAFLEAAVRISDHTVLCGGGVRRYDDLVSLSEIGISGALVATAVHDGSIPVSAIQTEEP